MSVYPLAGIVQKQLGGRSSPIKSSQIEARALYVASGQDPPRSHCGRRQCPSPPKF